MPSTVSTTTTLRHRNVSSTYRVGSGRRPCFRARPRLSTWSKVLGNCLLSAGTDHIVYIFYHHNEYSKYVCKHPAGHTATGLKLEDSDVLLLTKDDAKDGDHTAGHDATGLGHVYSDHNNSIVTSVHLGLLLAAIKGSPGPVEGQGRTERNTWPLAPHSRYWHSPQSYLETWDSLPLSTPLYPLLRALRCKIIQVSSPRWM